MRLKDFTEPALKFRREAQKLGRMREAYSATLTEFDRRFWAHSRIWGQALMGLFLLTAIAGCEAYANAMNGAINSGLLDVVDGDFKATNAMSIPICGITVFNDKDPNQSANHLHGAPQKPLFPGESKHVSIPHVGKAGEPTPEGIVYGLRVYACEKQAFDQKQGSLITTISPAQVKPNAEIIIK